MDLKTALADVNAFAQEDRDFVPTPSGEAFRDIQAFAEEDAAFLKPLRRAAADDAEIQKSFQDDLKGSLFPNLKAGVMYGFGSDVGKLLSRAVGDHAQADAFHDTATDVERAAKTVGKDSLMPEWWNAGVRGASRSAAMGFTAGGLVGPYGAIAAASAGEASGAVTEGERAGLEGSALANYAIDKGVWEAFPALVMQRLGLGGAESLFGKAGSTAVLKGIKDGIREVGKSALQEWPEELVTEGGHLLIDKLHGLNPEALSPESLWQTVRDTTVQTLMMTGAAGSPTVASSALAGRERAARLKALKDIRAKKFVTIDDGEEIGLTEEEMANRGSRKAAIDERIRQAEEDPESNSSETPNSSTVAAGPDELTKDEVDQLLTNDHSLDDIMGMPPAEARKLIPPSQPVEPDASGLLDESPADDDALQAAIDAALDALQGTEPVAAAEQPSGPTTRQPLNEPIAQPQAPIAPQGTPEPPPKPVVVEDPVDEQPKSALGQLEDSAKFPVRPVRTDEINADPETFQFKQNTGKGGVVEGEQLQGEYDPLAAGLMMLWERADGKLFAVNGHHRLDLAKRTKQPTVNAQVIREADGYTALDAKHLGAELNIKEGQGSQDDYARFFRYSKISEDEAQRRGLLARSKGRTGWLLGSFASDDNWAAYAGGKVSAEKAAAIADVGRGNDGLQRAGLTFAADKGRSVDEVRAFMQVLARSVGGSKESQGNLFGDDDAAIVEATKIATAVSKKINDIREQINTVRGLKGREQIAKEKFGIEADPESIAAKIDELREELAGWEKWTTDPAKVREARELAGLKLSEPELAAADEKPDVGVPGGQKGMFDTEDQGNLFNVTKPQKSDAPPSEPRSSTLEKIDDESKAEKRQPIAGQKDFDGTVQPETPKKQPTKRKKKDVKKPKNDQDGLDDIDPKYSLVHGDKPYTIADFRRAFPGMKVKRHPSAKDAFRFHLPNGHFVDVRTNDTIPINWAAAEKANNRTYSPEERRILRAAGSFTLTLDSGVKTSPLGIIILARDAADATTLPHEITHLALHLFIGQRERAALVRQFSSEDKSIAEQDEDISKAREVWDGPTGLRRRFIAFVNRLLRRLGFDALNGDDVFKLMQTPEFWSRQPQRMLEGTVYQTRAHHVSPHQFDKMSTAHIGTGEGNQVYGWGLYYLTSDEVKKHYKAKFKPGAGIKPIDTAYRIYEAQPARMPDQEKRANVVKELEKRRADSAALLADMRVMESIQGNRFDGRGETVFYVSYRRENGDVVASPSFKYRFEAESYIDGQKFKHDAMEKHLDAAIEQAKNHPMKAREYEVVLAPEETEYLLLDSPVSAQSSDVKSSLEKLASDSSVSVEFRRMARDAMAATGKPVKWREIDDVAYPEPSEDETEPANITEAREAVREFIGFADEAVYQRNPVKALVHEHDQKEIRRFVNKLNLLSPGLGDRLLGSITGHDLYNLLEYEAPRGGDMRGDEWASKKLLSHGIRGNKYLDGVSRKRGDGTFNYVIFDDADVEITAQYQLKPLPGDKQGGLSKEEEVSTRVPTVKAPKEDHLGSMLKVDYEAMKKTPEALGKAVALVRSYPNMRVGYDETDEQTAERFIEHVKSNLLWLHDMVPEDVRERSKLWYDGANRIAYRYSQEYGVSKRAAAGVMAVLSPQQDWFVNVDLARRVLDVYKNQQGHKWDDKMTSAALAMIENAETNDGAKSTARDVEAIRHKTLKQVEGFDLKALWLRLYSDAHLPSGYHVITPEGDVGKKQSTKYDDEGSIRWGSGAMIAKAISIIEDSSLENISKQLGQAHKVRSFYNNIISPDSSDDHVTMDTHAGAAAYLRPLSGESTEVKHFMGGGGGHGATGLQGTYALLAEGYRRAAEERGLLPREIQSITWEAIRGMFSPEFKRAQGPDLGKINAKLNKGKISRREHSRQILQMKARRTIDRIWNLYKQGATSLEQARIEILRETNGVEYPDWHEGGVSTAGRDGKSRPSADEGDVSRFGVLGPAPESVVGGRRDALAADFSGPRISRRVDPQYQFKSSGPDAKVVAEPEKAAARVAMAATKGGVSTFAEYVAMAADDLGYDGAMSIARVLERTWNTLRKRKGFEHLDEAGKTADVLKKPAKAPPERPQVKAVASGDSTGTKNAKTNQLRDKAGFAERPDIIPETRDQWDMAAKRRMTKDPQYAGKLAEELLMGDEPRGIDPVEEMALNRHIRGLENRRQAGEDVIEDMWTAISAAERVGTVWGRSGVARQAERAADFSFEGILRQHKRSVNEKPTDEQMAKYDELAAKAEKLEGELIELWKVHAQAIIDKEIAEARAEKAEKAAQAAQGSQASSPSNPTPEPKKGTKKERLQKQASDAVSSFKDAWAKVVKAAKDAASRPTSGGLDVKSIEALSEAAKAAAGVIKAYAELGVESFLELMARFKQDIGDLDADQRKVFEDEWDKFADAKPATELFSQKPAADEIGQLARELTRWAVESGITKRDEVVDAVHKELLRMKIEVTRSETMEAMSGYGDYRLLSKEPLDVKIREIRGELQQLLKLEDMQAGRAPKATGVERRTPSDEERILIKQVNEAKKRGGYVITNPASQLKSALDAAKTAIENRIKDLGQEIATKVKIVKNPTSLTPDADLIKLRAIRDALVAEHKKIFPPKKSVLSDARRLQMAEQAMDRQIADLQKDLAAGRLGPKDRPAPLTSPAIEAKRTQLDQLKEAREKARAASPAYQAQLEAKRNAAYKKSLERQLSFWSQRRDNARSGILPTQKRKLTPSDEAILEKKYQLEVVKRQARAEIEEAERAARGNLGKALGIGGDLADLSRSVQTGYEMSAVLRQGAFYTLGFPRQALPALMNSVRAAFSRRADFAIHDDLMKRRNHKDYVRGGLETTADDGPLSGREELLRSRFASWLAQGPSWSPLKWGAEGIKGGERAFRTFLNTARADLFDYMKEAVAASRPGTWSEDDAKVIANAANVFSGRAPMDITVQGKKVPIAVGMSRVFFAPRWVWSRALVLTGQPLWKGTSASRKAVARVYIRAALGMAAFQVIKHALYSLGADDDEHEPEYELDPRSSDAGKTKLGDSRIDSGTGVNQLITLAARLMTGETKRSTGEIVPIHGEDVRPGADDSADVIHRFLRSKLAPIPSGVLDWIVGKNVVGEEATLGKIITDRAMPMTWRDIWEAEKELGVAQGTVAAIEAFFGSGISTYGDRSKYRDADEAGRKDLFDKHLNRMEWNSPDPDYFGELTAEQRKRVADRREEERQNVVTAGVRAKPKRTYGDTDDSYQKKVESQQRAAEKLEAMRKGIDHDDAQQLLADSYRRPDDKGKPQTEVDRQTKKLKDSYREKARALSKLYGRPDDDWLKWRAMRRKPR